MKPIRKNRFVLMVGPPGSGKTRYLKEHCPEARILSIGSPRDRQAHADCEMAFVQALKNNVSFLALDHSNLRHRDRMFYLASARAYDYEVELVVLRPEPARLKAVSIPPEDRDQVLRRASQQNLPSGVYAYTHKARFLRDLPADCLPLLQENP